MMINYEFLKQAAASIEADMDALRLNAADEYPLPDPDVSTDTDEALYHSRRGYWTQMSAYHHYKHNGDNADLEIVLTALSDSET